VHGTAAADRDEDVDAVFLGHSDAGFDMPARRVLFDRVEDSNLQLGLTQKLRGPLRMARRFQPRISDEQRAGAAQLPRQLPKARQRADAENHPRQRMEIERRQRPRQPAGTGRSSRIGEWGLHTFSLLVTPWSCPYQTEMPVPGTRN